VAADLHLTSRGRWDQHNNIDRTVILPVLYGYESWSITLRERDRLRMFENGVQRMIIRTKRDEVRGEWRRLHKEELYDLYSTYIIRVIKK
jgi:hypothetical protein